MSSDTSADSADSAAEALPASLARTPRLSRWLTLDPTGTVTVRVGKVEIGQGIVTALAQIAADELDVAVERIVMTPASTAYGPNEGTTAGSRSIQDSGASLAQAGAHARAILIAAAAEALGSPAAGLRVEDGTVVAPSGERITYWELTDPDLLDVDVDRPIDLKSPAARHVVGDSTPRLDLPDKVYGRRGYIQDLRLPGQRYGRVVRPPSPAAALVEADTEAVRTMPGVVTVVHEGRFLGVVADTEIRAERAAAALATYARWTESPTLPDEDDLSGYLRSAPNETFVAHEAVAGTSPSAPAATVAATYNRPFLAHASMAPSAGAARWDGTTLEVWTHSQGVHPLRAAVAQALELPAGRIAAHHVESAGCYGHNGADDAAFDAVVLALAAPGDPVHVRWSRADELSWAPFSSAMTVDLTAELDAAGRISSWRHEVWSQGHSSRPGYAGTPGLLAATHRAGLAPVPAADPPPQGGAGLTRNAVPTYDFPTVRVIGHRVLSAPLRSSAMRTLGAHANVFAAESFMDELAARAGADPVEFRLAHLRDPRARAVLEAVATRSGWGGSRGPAGTGRGVAYARYKGTAAYCAVVAEVEADSEVRVSRLWLAVDVGTAVNPDGVRNQVEGGAVQATSWTVKERVRFDRTRVTSTTWEDYPILGFTEVPEVDVEVLDRPDQPSLGVGEASPGPTSAALGNAVADALGIRVRDLPLSARNIVAAIERAD